jgi:hypothetical protein
LGLGLDAEIDDVTDVITEDIEAEVDCGVDFPFTLEAGEKLECDYSAELDDGEDRENTAEVVVTENSKVLGNSTTEDVSFEDPEIIDVNDEVEVEDTNEAFADEYGEDAMTDDDKTYTYTVTFTCGADEGLHGNTAKIVETGQKDDASVTVNCYDLEVTKDANTSFTRTWDWTIKKKEIKPRINSFPRSNHILLTTMLSVDARFRGQRLGS